MSDNPLSPIDPIEAALARTPARVLVGRNGPGYCTSTALKLREDHAVARDAVRAEIDLATFGAERIATFGLFEVRTRATSKGEYLLRPDLGRQLADESRELVRSSCPAGCDFQVVIGDGLSATAATVQAPDLLDQLRDMTTARGWSFGRPFLVRYCRVGVLNDVGELLNPAVVVLLIGERPGLATAESLSAYMAYRPRTGHTDADRNLISNIHARGVPIDAAGLRVMALAEQFRAASCSGICVKEAWVGNPSHQVTTSIPLHSEY